MEQFSAADHLGCALVGTQALHVYVLQPWLDRVLETRAAGWASAAMLPFSCSSCAMQTRITIYQWDTADWPRPLAVATGCRPGHPLSSSS